MSKVVSVLLLAAQALAAAAITAEIDANGNIAITKRSMVREGEAVMAEGTTSKAVAMDSEESLIKTKIEMAEEENGKEHELESANEVFVENSNFYDEDIDEEEMENVEAEEAEEDEEDEDDEDDEEYEEDEEDEKDGQDEIDMEAEEEEGEEKEAVQKPNRTKSGKGAGKKRGGKKHVDFTLETVAVNNLGGQGPSGGLPELRYEHVANVDDAPVDLVVTAQDEFSPGLLATSADHQGAHGKFGFINVLAGTNVTLLFSFVNATTSDPVVLPKFVFTFFDIDGGYHGTMTESVSVSNFKTYFTSKTPALSIHEDTAGHRTVFTGTSESGSSDTPTDPLALSAGQKAKTVSFVFRHASSFTANLLVTASAHPEGGEGRNFIFAGSSSLSEAVRGKLRRKKGGKGGGKRGGKGGGKGGEKRGGKTRGAKKRGGKGRGGAQRGGKKRGGKKQGGKGNRGKVVGDVSVVRRGAGRATKKK